MMNRYFTECKTAEQLKAAYKKLILKNHPDNGGDPEICKAINAEYEAAWERLKNIHTDKDGNFYEKETSETAAEYMDLISKLVKMAGVSVELCGSWLWLTGNTKEYKDQIKALGFKWAKNKAAWYFHREPYRKHNNKKMSMDDIRRMYGSKLFSSYDQPEEPEYLTT